MLGCTSDADLMLVGGLMLAALLVGTLLGVVVGGRLAARKGG